MKKKSAKGFSKESIEKVVKLMNAARFDYRDINSEDIKLCISKGNKKIGRVLNVSLPPILTCANCHECMHYCYDIKACLQYPNTVIDARIRNLTILQKDRAAYFNRIRKALKNRRKNRFFRWHVSGDIIDMNYLQNMIDIAIEFPDFIFWTYTKNYTLVNNYITAHGDNVNCIPSNLSIMFSEWKGLEMVNPYNMPVFACKFPDDPTPHAYRCPGNCDVCKRVNRGCIKGENTYNDLH